MHNNHDNDDATPTLQHLQISDGTTLAYRELGEDANGEPRDVMMLLHGWPTSSYLWRGVMPEIAAHARVLALDLPGFGGSDKPRRCRFGFADFERAIDGFLNALGVNVVTVAGHDLGGPIAMHWALRNPGRVRGVVMLNTLLYPDFHPSVFEFVTTLATPATRDELTAPEGLAGMMRAGVADGSVLAETVLAAVAAPFADAADRLTLARAGIGLEPSGFEEIAAGLPSLHAPVRAVYGTQDRILPDVGDTMARLQRDVPHTEVTALADCGHFLQEERPDEVGRLLATFAASLAVASRATR